MKKALMTFLLPLLFVGLPMVAMALKIGVVDLQRALQEVDEGKKAKSDLEKEFQDKKGRLDKEQNDIRKLSEEFQKSSVALSPEARNKKGMELQNRMAQWQESVASSQEQIQQKEASLTRPILEGLREIIPELSKEQKVSVVLEMNTAGLLYAEESEDLTEELIKRYNSSKKGRKGRR